MGTWDGALFGMVASVLHLDRVSRVSEPGRGSLAIYRYCITAVTGMIHITVVIQKGTLVL